MFKHWIILVLIELEPETSFCLTQQRNCSLLVNLYKNRVSAEASCLCQAHTRGTI